jgi:hypothetical protein
MSHLRHSTEMHPIIRGSGSSWYSNVTYQSTCTHLPYLLSRIHYRLLTPSPSLLRFSPPRIWHSLPVTHRRENAGGNSPYTPGIGVTRIRPLVSLSLTPQKPRPHQGTKYTVNEDRRMFFRTHYLCSHRVLMSARRARGFPHLSIDVGISNHVCTYIPHWI